MSSTTIIARFDRGADVEAAISDLVANGVPAQAITRATDLALGGEETGIVIVADTLRMPEIESVLGGHHPNSIDRRDGPGGVTRPPIHRVQATFATPEQAQMAIDQLQIAGFDRAYLSLPDLARLRGWSASESSAKPANTDTDAQQMRTLHTSMAAAVAALAATAVVVGTGGTAIIAFAGAAAAGAAAGGAMHVLSDAPNKTEQNDRDAKADIGALVLTVEAPSPELMEKAEPIMRAAGATDFEVG